MKAFRKVIFAAVDVPGVQILLNRFQDSLEEVFRDIQRAEILDGVLLESIAIDTSTTRISHRLGRPLRGWYIVRKRANATIWDLQDSESSPDKFLSLRASAPVTVDIWVF